MQSWVLLDMHSNNNHGLQSLRKRPGQSIYVHSRLRTAPWIPHLSDYVRGRAPSWLSGWLSQLGLCADLTEI